jgi:hypothetical protein
MILLHDMVEVLHRTEAAGCCGQVKTDTQLSCLSDVFVRIGTDIPEIRMFVPTVIEHLDVIHHVIPRLLPRHIIALRRALTLQAAEKPLCDRIVSTLPLATHATRNTMLSQKASVGMTGILRPPVTMMAQASTGLATPQRHRQRIPNQWRLNMITHGPPHHLAGTLILDSRVLRNE